MVVKQDTQRGAVRLHSEIVKNSRMNLRVPEGRSIRQIAHELGDI